MSPSDASFLKALGIKPEEIVPAGPVTCPQCAGKRHRLGGALICLSCAAREKRDREEAQRRQDLQLANDIQAQVDRCGRPLPNYLQMAQEAYNEYQEKLRRETSLYRGWEIMHRDGTGWCYRLPGDNIFGHWMKALSRLDAERRIGHFAGPDINAGPDIADFALPERVDNECRGCGAPCGHRFWCRSCGLDKFGRR